VSIEKEKFEKLQNLIGKKAYAQLATLLKSRGPHLIPIWIDFDGENLYINTIVGSQKDKNMIKSPEVALSVIDPENPSSSVLIRGKVIDRDLKNAEDHVNKLAQHYTGKNYTGPKGKRALYKIQPLKVIDVNR
jgi:nitroimidazol reductase NimA-like FMN-containing flavoprotein (pyridoxamine 5'-phosphate oxidase superfamily)